LGANHGLWGNVMQSLENFRVRGESIEDPISALTASDKSLVVSRESGLIHQYLLPHIRWVDLRFDNGMVALSGHCCSLMIWRFVLAS